MLRGVRKRFVNIMKVYIERKNMQVQLIPLRKKNIDFIDVGKFEVGNVRDRRVYESALIAIRDVPPLLCAGQSHGYNTLRCSESGQ